mmetsp:Transcript_13649/g.29277  ORF Transcript_13649/g.29277 Transcript_13649/m.29277 type:complete len:433 (-) Transcript_13649:309-1607(-)|eukprot:CAMPEP_0202900692 /NCGR_PEP_ID=MMETSP1392-20130828/11985_1 /ASSEMBLY_ACC=CAM_ASM_000868 /TAXON_ID=225041 /ORGANISM="Chlamydomonas chlamydogama, Strain SAG 11-48b" /LENGTH=432 /DNA_ID=CAMNT_0049587133 /DNA_START=93 /DNA_END=1391 /DNA_ORIENTATION=+
MPSSSFKVVCLGGGNAAGYLIKELVALGKVAPADIAVITDEAVVAYERPALSKGYLAPEGAARLPGFHTCVGGGGERQDPAWYQAKGITYLTKSSVTSVDVASKVLSLASGDSVQYEQLVVATGARPVTLTDIKLPGDGLEGVHYLRNEEQAAALVAGIKAAKERGGKAVVIGGGYIGMEVAAGLAGNGLAVTVVFPEDRLLSRLFTPQIAAFYEKFYQAKGITLLKGATLLGVEGEGGKVARVAVKAAGAESKLEAALVVVGVGARANTELFAGKLELAAGGIKVNGQLESSVPGVYAIGDVAAFPLAGAAARQEHVTHARQSAAHVAKAISGAAPGDYAYLPFFYSRVFNLSWVFYGSSEGEVVHFGDYEAGPKIGAYWVKGGKVVGAFLESGSADEAAALKTLAAAAPAAPPSEELAQQGITFALGAKL